MIDSIRRLGPRIALIAAAGACTGAGSTSAQLGVSAAVRAIASIERESDPAGLSISRADLRRGYVDAGTPIGLVVKSNSASGFAIDVVTLAPIATAIEIRGLGADVSLGPDGGTVVERWHRSQQRTLRLRMRFRLAPGIAAGEYPWPVRLAVRPLDAD
jgi:hypothetical protein